MKHHADALGEYAFVDTSVASTSSTTTSTTSSTTSTTISTTAHVKLTTTKPPWMFSRSGLTLTSVVHKCMAMVLSGEAGAIYSSTVLKYPNTSLHTKHTYTLVAFSSWACLLTLAFRVQVARFEATHCPALTSRHWQQSAFHLTQHGLDRRKGGSTRNRGTTVDASRVTGVASTD